MGMGMIMDMDKGMGMEMDCRLVHILLRVLLNENDSHEPHVTF